MSVSLLPPPLPFGGRKKDHKALFWDVTLKTNIFCSHGLPRVHGDERERVGEWRPVVLELLGQITNQSGNKPPLHGRGLVHAFKVLNSITKGLAKCVPRGKSGLLKTFVRSSFFNIVFYISCWNVVLYFCLSTIEAIRVKKLIQSLDEKNCPLTCCGNKPWAKLLFGRLSSIFLIWCVGVAIVISADPTIG